MKKLTLDLYTIGRINLPLAVGWTPNTQLQTLSLYGQLRDISSHTEERLSYFSRDRFINISFAEVNIYIERQYDIERVPAMFKRAFADINSAVYINGYWTDGWERIDN